MKLNTAIRIAKDCGLGTVGEAIVNIKMHATSMFSYDEIGSQLSELDNDFIASGKSLKDEI